MTQYTFMNDLHFGNVMEKCALDYIKYDSYEFAPTCVFKEYDISTVLNGENITYEIKADRIAYKTGNLAIEYMSGNKSSGISSTKADFYIYFIITPNGHNIVYKIPTYKIIEFIDNKKYFKNIYGGDNYNSKMFLFKLDIFDEFVINKNLP